jgi:hypothetical protein
MVPVGFCEEYDRSNTSLSAMAVRISLILLTIEFVQKNNKFFFSSFLIAAT